VAVPEAGLPARARPAASKSSGSRDAGRPTRPAGPRQPRATAKKKAGAVSRARVARDEILHEPRANERLQDAARAYASDRYQDALKLLRKLAALAPGSPAVRELLGLTLYRLGKWSAAVRELEAHHLLSGSYDQYPVIADSYRALHRYEDAEQVWAELREASPSAEVVAEGRLVAAGALADRGDFNGAVRLLESSLRASKPKPLHLRQWYALADLYERAGELPRARDLFGRIASVDPDAYDVRQRLVALA